MKKALLILALVFIAKGYSQILEPVEWETSVEKYSDSEYILISKAKIENGWHLYSQEVSEDGPIPTSFVYYDSQDNFNLIDGTTEERGITVYDSIFQKRIKYFEKSAVFTQKIILASDTKLIKGSVEFMVCDNSRCLAPFEIDLIYELNLYDANQGETLVDEEKSSSINFNNSEVNNFLYGLSVEDLSWSQVGCGNEVEINKQILLDEGSSFWNIFGLGLLGGLLALLTPCVFPMIPLTVSFFTKKNDDNKKGGAIQASIYGLFIFIVYLVLSIPFHLLDSISPDILNEISTNVWLNVVFFLIFVVFAFSLFGFYELSLPASWTSITSRGEGKSGYVGIFFMALTLAIVSFSCTGPILGTLLAGSLSANSGAWLLTAGMAGFGFSLGLPFALFAMFPKMIGTFPKSGEWLNTIKIVLGFLELALAFKFLSNADLVAHWNILKIEPFLIIWILIFSGMSLYFFGKIKFPNNFALKKSSLTKMAGGVLTASFVVYLISGFLVDKNTKTFTPLRLLSGLTPPVGYSFWRPNECPNNLVCFKDLKKGVEFAMQKNKPILLDFTGYACVNCRKMEEHVWPIKTIDSYLRNEFVLISLYVDDKKELPSKEKIPVKTRRGGIRVLQTYGQKWANFQTQYFKTNSQPFYVLLNSEGKIILNQGIGYTPNQEEYLQFLECGIKVNNEMNKVKEVFDQGVNLYSH